MARGPQATYRLQLHPGFTLDDAAAVAGYLARLGITHVYSSPYLQAAPGSMHGYDVMDPTQVNEDLGGEEAHQRFNAALGENNLGQVLDIVPNHMAISGPQNEWWWNVLENGLSSPYAAYFDMEWESPESRLGNRILLPVLGKHYGRALEERELKLEREGEKFVLQYFQHKFPIAPRSLAPLLYQAAERANSEELVFIADALSSLPLPSFTDQESTQKRHRSIRMIRRHLQQLLESSPEVASAVDLAVQQTNGDPDALHELLERQNYRVAFWRTAAQDLGYRRFFDINTLVGVRVEDEQVFNDTHCRILEWLEKGVLDGVRIDHPDGLRDPEQYLRRLHKAAPGAWIVVEKILHPGERLPVTWPVAGTTGYDYLNNLGGLFVDPNGEKPLTDFYREFTGETTEYHELARQKKHQVMNLLFGSDLNRLTELLMRICERHRRYRDYTRVELSEGIREVIACFPVYRTYVRAEAEEFRLEDRQIITESLEAARNNRPDLDPEMFRFLTALLLREYRGDLETEFVMRFQQVTGPITAKGIEDTVFYCYNRFVALNEVGGDPARFGLSVEAFHQKMTERALRWPQAMLTLSTHDTKRSEDVRARLALLSEMPQQWTEAVRRWSQKAEKYRADNWPDRNTEYFLYQALVGAWPIEKERLTAYMEKSVREAKVHSSWTKPEPQFETAVRNFTSSVLEDQELRGDIEQFVGGLTWFGRINSLSQTLIKLTSPGVPDTYQGTELWDLSLVDPDNRRPVDFSRRQNLLDDLCHLSPEEIMSRMDDGLPKLYLIQRTLSTRNRLAELFLSAPYQSIAASGERADNVVGFLRGDQVITVAPRLLISLGNDWRDTTIELPAGSWRNELSTENIEGGKVSLAQLLSKFPAALLVKE